MEPRAKSRFGVTTRISVAIMLAILAVAGSASYLSFTQGTAGLSTTSSTSAVTTSGPTGSTESSTSSVSSTPSSSLPSSSPSLSTSSGSVTHPSTLTTSSPRNLSQVQVIIPAGIDNIANKISFEPLNITIVIGVNNTVYFTNHDDQEHILESTLWPTAGQPFQIYSLPGTGESCVKGGAVPNCVTFTTPGKYNYFCEWHPIWMDGTINVVA